MKNDATIHIGVIGVGHLGNFHLKQFSKISEISLCGLYDINEIRAKEMSELYNIPYFTNLQKLLKKSDAVSIVTPTFSHYEVAEKALNEDCHIFIEKPITDDLYHASKLLKKANNNNKIIQVGHIEQFNPAFIALKKIKNYPRFIESHRLAPFNIRGNDVPVILDLMIHDIDIILSIIKSKIINIRANGVRVTSDTIDIANSRIEFENGCIANLTASRISQKEMRKMRLFEKKSYITLDFMKETLEEYKVCSKKPIDSSNNQIIEIGNEQKKYVLYNKPSIKKHNALKEELKHFVHSIKSSTIPITNGNNAINALRVALKIQSIIDK